MAELAAFADARKIKPGPTCLGCRLPQELRAAIREARQADPMRYTYPILAAYAKAKGHPITPTCLRDHFRRGHEEATA